jgi:hypothetical protein
MIRLSCLSVRHRLAAFHDGELTIAEQVGTERHLRECRRCAVEAAQYGAVGDALRVGAAMQAVPIETIDGLAESVVSRMKAEREESLAGRFGRMFEDLHLVWTVLGASGSALACLALMVGIFYFGASRERPDSLAGLLAAMASPGSNANPVQIDDRMILPRANTADEFPAIMRDEDAVFIVAAMVTREGRVANAALVQENGSLRNSSRERQEVLDLLDSISNTRFEPARAGGAPVAVNMVWMLANVTVRAKARGESRLMPSVEVISETFRLADPSAV